MNREQRRLEAKRRKAISKELTRMEKPEQYHLGFNDGGKAMTEAAYAAFCSSMANAGYSAEEIVAILVDVDERLVFYAGEDDLIKEAFEKTGILIDFSQVFSESKFQLKEREP